MPKATKHTPVEDLYYSMIDVQPVNFDWSEGYTEKWDYLALSCCEKCGKEITGRNGEAHNDLDPDSDCDGYVPENEGPMMNYYYPLPEFDGDTMDAAKKLINTPLVIVEFLDSGDYALALSGGGMDLSWEICEAYMRLGYLPPAHFCRLPQMAGRGTGQKDRWIIDACERSLKGMRDRFDRDLAVNLSNFKYRKPRKGPNGNRKQP